MIGLGGCKGKEPGNRALDRAADSLGWLSGARHDSLLAQRHTRSGYPTLKTVQGVVYLSGSDSLAALSIETDTGNVLVLVGAESAALRAHQHQKVSATGFWKPGSVAGVRDTLEVVDFELLRD